LRDLFRSAVALTPLCVRRPCRRPLHYRCSLGPPARPANTKRCQGHRTSKEISQLQRFRGAGFRYDSQKARVTQPPLRGYREPTLSLVTLSPCHPVTTLSPRHLVTLSPCHLVTPSPCHLVTLSPPAPPLTPSKHSAVLGLCRSPFCGV